MVSVLYSALLQDYGNMTYTPRVYGRRSVIIQPLPTPIKFGGYVEMIGN